MSKDDDNEIYTREFSDSEIKMMASVLRGMVAAAAELDDEDHEDDDEIGKLSETIIEQFKQYKVNFNSNVDRLLARLEKLKEKDSKSEGPIS